MTAPGPIDPNAQKPKSETDKKLEDAEEDDSGRGLTWFWLEFEGGFQHMGLETFEVDQSNLTAGFVASEASGGFSGAGLGAQLLYFRIGPRGRIGFYKDWQMFSIGGELGIRFPLGPIEPHINLGAGYTALGSVSDTLNAVPDSVKISGFDVRVGGGLDFFIGNVFFIGASASWEFLGLTRPGVSLDDINASSATNLDEAQKAALAAEGSGYGSAISIGGKLGLAF